MIAMFRRGLFYSYLSVYLRHYLGLSVTETTLFATLPMILNVVFQTFIWGRVSDKYQLRRTLIITGELLAGVGTILVWYAHRLAAGLVLSGYVIIIGLALIEIFWSMSNVGWSALISDVYSEKKRSRIQGRLASIGGIGRIAGVWIGGLLYDGLGHKYPGWGFYGGSIFIVTAVAMFLSTLPMLFVPEGGAQPENKGADAGEEVPGDHHLKGVFAFFLTAMMFINFGRNSIILLQPQYLMLESGLGVSSSVLGYIVNTQSVAMILCGLAVGGVASLIGTGRALLAGTLSAIAGIVLIAVSTDLKWIYLSYFLRGFSEVIIMATSYTFASTLIPAQKRGRQFALYNATFFLSWGLAGTLITGPLVDLLIKNGHVETIAYRISFYSAAVITLVGFSLLTYLLYGILPKRLCMKRADIPKAFAAT
jgi:MFS family permease